MGYVYVVAGIIFVILVLVLCVGPMRLSGMISQQERDEFYREHDYWLDY